MHTYLVFTMTNYTNRKLCSRSGSLLLIETLLISPNLLILLKSTIWIIQSHAFPSCPSGKAWWRLHDDIFTNSHSFWVILCISVLSNFSLKVNSLCLVLSILISINSLTTTVQSIHPHTPPWASSLLSIKLSKQLSFSPHLIASIERNWKGDSSAKLLSPSR